MNNKPFSKMFDSNTSVYLIIIFLLAVLPLIISNNIILAVAGIAVWLAVTVYSFIHESKRESEMMDYVQKLSFHTDTTSKDSLLRFPLPLSIFQLNGNMIWYNEKFKKCFNPEGFEMNISDITEDANMEVFMEASEEGVPVSYNGRYYRVLPNTVRSEVGEVLIIMYWLDETKLVELKEIYDNSRPVVCSIIIDNYDEVIQNTPDSAKSMLFGNIEKIITEWANSTGGILKKIERDKYFLIFESKYLKDNIEKKFDVTEKIKALNLGNKIPVTVSIGIGIDGKTLSECDLYARNSIEMALGRGGDQAVIKDTSKFSYFGGSGKEVEKYTRVKTRVMAFALNQLISQADKIIIMGHKNADLDSFGASMGICSAAVNAGKPVYVVMNTPNAYTNKMVARFRESEQYRNRIISGQEAVAMATSLSLIVVVDVFKPSLTEEPELLNITDNIVVIDHHRKSSEFIENASLAYHEPSASSASEMVTELLQYINDGVSINSLIAEALYAGIELDTKNFTFKTGVRTFEAAAYLRRKGIDPTRIKALFQNDKTVYTLRTDIVKNSEIYRGCIAISHTESNYYDIQGITAAAADELLDIEGISASFTMCRIDDKTYISGRSIGTISVQIILETIGGGGHGLVAGAQLSCDFEEATRILKDAIDKYLDDNRKE